MAVLAQFSISHSKTVQELVIVGTGSGVPLLEAIGKAFTDHHPDVRITIPESIGSGGGIKAVWMMSKTFEKIGTSVRDELKN
jgi:phosphate transport system substrate-binding protein